MSPIIAAFLDGLSVSQPDPTEDPGWRAAGSGVPASCRALDTRAGDVPVTPRARTRPLLKDDCRPLSIETHIMASNDLVFRPAKYGIVRAIFSESSASGSEAKNLENHSTAGAGTSQVSYKKKYMSIVIVLGGSGRDYHMIRHPYILSIAHFTTVRKDIEWIIVYNPTTMPSVLELPRPDLNGNVRHILLDADVSDTAGFFSCGLLAASGPSVAFSWPGIDLSTQLAALDVLHQALVSQGGKFVAGLPSSAELCGTPGLPFLPQGAVEYTTLKEYALGHIQMLDIVPMSNSLVDASFAKEIGFRSSQDVGRCFWWDFSVRAARYTDISVVNQPAPFVAFNWYDYPLGTINAVDYKELSRNIIKKPNPRANEDRVFRERDLIDNNVCGLFEAPINVLIISGIHDAAHFQLCFLNFFERFDHLGVLNWRILLDTNCKPSDLLGEDIVIFCRIRSENGVKIAQYSREINIPTIFMIDDNWIRIGECWPEYRPMFSWTSPSMRNFSSIVRLCDLTLCYNQLIADDVAPMARRVARIETNVNLEDFSATGVRAEVDGPRQITVGYAGSARKERSAFSAMARLAMEVPNVRLFVMSHEMPSEFATLDQSKIIFRQYTHSYSAYIRAVESQEVDIFVAPLDDNMFESSKCPNKFLEISAFRGVGVYSNVEPYTSYVRNWETGVLVKNSANDWYSVLSALTSPGAASLRSKLIEQAYHDVKENFDTHVRGVDFFKVLTSLLPVNKNLPPL